MSKKQKIKKENPKPTFVKTKKKVKPPVTPNCDKYDKLVNDILDKREKVNSLKPCGEEEERCPCSGRDGNPKGQKTDLIVLIDSSGSMRTPAGTISSVVQDAIKAAQKSCEPDLKITFLGVDDTFSGTVFNQSHRDYIVGLRGAVTLRADNPPGGLNTEKGAKAIEDLSQHADWRKGACRAIFYISDEELDSIDPRNDFANEDAVTNAAIAAANANKVTVFAHHLTYQNLAPSIIQNYKDLCDKTGGEAYFSPAADKKEYIRLLTDVICNSCGKDKCTELEFPTIEPCISVNWGDSPCDAMESSDYEVVTIKVCNCYTNITLKDFSISMICVVDKKGKPVQTLPNGTPSIKLHPVGPHCFGDIAPCSCVTREFVVINEGAKEGDYKILLKGVCYHIEKSYANDEICFELVICKD